MATRPIALALLAVLALAGCKPKTDGVAAAPDQQTTAASAAKPSSGGGSSDTITPIGPNVGGITPVAGGENLGGTGGGSGDAAKGMAHSAASKAGGSSLSQMGSD